VVFHRPLHIERLLLRNFGPTQYSRPSQDQKKMPGRASAYYGITRGIGPLDRKHRPVYVLGRRWRAHPEGRSDPGNWDLPAVLANGWPKWAIPEGFSCGMAENTPLFHSVRIRLAFHTAPPLPPISLADLHLWDCARHLNDSRRLVSGHTFSKLASFQLKPVSSSFRTADRTLSKRNSEL
jgi:hypothetical protein